MAKKIGAITSLSIIGILIVLTIILANVNFNYNIKCANPYRIYVQKSSSSRVVVEDETIQNSIKNYINNASQEAYISALFNGRLNQKAEIVSDNTTGKDIPSTSNYYVTYVYNKPQTLQDGKKDYKDSNGNRYYYRELVFSVSATDGEATVKVYVIPYYNSDDQVSVDNKYTKYYELKADFDGLYNYLVENY